MADYSELKRKAQEIRDEVKAGANTANRVGLALEETVKALEAENQRAEQAEVSLENSVQLLQDETEDLPSIREQLETLVVNDLTTGGADKALSAEMGKVLSAELTELGSKVKYITAMPEPSGIEEVIEFQDDDGGYIASVSPSGIKSKSYIVKKGTDEYAIDRMAVTDENGADLAIGDDNGKNIVVFYEGHIQTKNFDSRQITGDIADIESDIEQLKQQGSQSLSALRKALMLEDFYSYKKGHANGDWYDRLRLMHFSDTHRNLVNLSEALNLSKDMVHLVLDTGDNANGVASTAAATTIAELGNYQTLAAPISLTAPLVVCAGNHDVPNLTKKQFYDVICKLVVDKSPTFVYGDSLHYRTYGYIDITANETIGTVRVVVLDPFDYDDGQFMNPYGQTGTGGWMNCVFSQTQINWLIATLRGAASNGYKVITTMHYSFGDNTVFTPSGSANPDANYHQDPFMIPDIIDAMQNKTTLSKSYPDDENINNIVINEDFSGINDFHYICHLFGHIHSENEYQCQKTDGSKFYDMLMVGAPNMGSEGYALNKVPLQPNTINSIKLTLLEIDTLEHTVYRVNYGAYKAIDFSSTERSKRISYRFTNE